MTDKPLTDADLEAMEYRCKAACSRAGDDGLVLVDEVLVDEVRLLRALTQDAFGLLADVGMGGDGWETQSIRWLLESKEWVRRYYAACPKGERTGE